MGIKPEINPLHRLPLPMITICADEAKRQSKRRGVGFLAAIMAAGKLNGRTIAIDYAHFRQILSEHPSRRGIGDRLEALIKPFAKAFRIRCLDLAGNLKPESRCAKRRDFLNSLSLGEFPKQDANS
jgi:hypothetical protein